MISNQHGGYYYDKNIIMILGKIVKNFIYTITKQNTYKFITNKYTIDIEKFETFLKDYRSKNYDEIVQFIVSYYNPFNYFENEKQQYIIFDHEGLPINKSFIYNDINSKCLQINDELIFQKYECPKNILNTNFFHRDKLSYSQILLSLQKKTNDLDINVKNKWNIVQAGLLLRDGFVPFFRQFREMNQDIEQLYDMFYNNLNELTSRPNPLKNMVDTATIHYFFELLNDEKFMHTFNKLPQNNVDFFNMNNEFAKIELKDADVSKITKNDFNNILEKSDFFDKYKNLNTYGLIVYEIHGKLKSQTQRITNSISIETIYTAFANLKDMSLFVLVKSFCLSAINECEKIMKTSSDTLNNIAKMKNKKVSDVFTYISKYEPFFPHNLAIKTDEQNPVSIEKFSLALAKATNTNKKQSNTPIPIIEIPETINTHILDFGTYIDLLYMKTMINDAYAMINPKSKFTIKYNDLEIGNQIKYVAENLKTYDGRLTSNINLEEFKKEVNETYQLYYKLLELLKTYLEELSSNDDYIDDVINVFYDQDNNFTTNNDNGIFFHQKIIGAIMSKIGNMPNHNYYQKILESFVSFNRVLDFNDFVEKIPVFRNVLDKQLGIYDSSNPNSSIFFSTVLNKINTEIFSPNKRPINYYIIFIASLIKIFYLISKIDKYFIFKNNILNVGSMTSYMYVAKLLERIPNYSSINAVVKGLFGDLSIAQTDGFNEKFIQRISDYLELTYRSVGYNRASGIPDCMESEVRDFINVLILEKNELNIKKLPNTTIKPVREFYNKYNILDKHYSKNLDTELRTEWVKIFNTIIKNALAKKYPGHAFFHTDRKNKFQDIKSSFINFTNVLMIFFSDETTTSLDYGNAKNECSTKLNSIMDKFNTNAKIVFENSANEMRIEFDNGLVFDIHDGHALMIESSTISRDEVLNTIKKYAHDNMPFFIYLIEHFEDNNYYFEQLVNSLNITEQELRCRLIAFYNHDRKSEKSVFESLNINLVDLFKICEQNNCTSLYIKNMFDFNNNNINLVYDHLLLLPNIEKYIPQCEIESLYKINLDDYYAQQNNTNQYLRSKIDPFFNFVETVCNKINLQNIDQKNKKGETNDIKIMKRVITDNIEQLECLFAVFMEKKYNNNKLYNLLETAMSNYKFSDTYTIDIIKMFFIPYRLQLFLEQKQNQNYDNFTYDYVGNWINNIDKINKANKKILFSCDKPLNVVNATKNKKFSVDTLEEIRKAIIYNDGISDNKLMINRIFNKFVWFVVPFNLIDVLKYIHPNIFTKLTLTYNKPKLLSFMLEKIKSKNSAVESYAKQLAEKMKQESKGGSKNLNRTANIDETHYRHKYYKYKQKYLSLMNSTTL